MDNQEEQRHVQRQEQQQRQPKQQPQKHQQHQQQQQQQHQLQLLPYRHQQPWLQQRQPWQQQQQQQEGTDAAAGGQPLRSRLPWASTVHRGWEPVEVHGSVLPESRSGAASCVYKNCLFVFGGYGGLTRLGNLYKFDFTKSVWEEVQSPGTPSPRESNGAVVLNGKMFIFGGYSGVQWLNDLHAFDLEREEWTELPHWGMIPSPRFGYVAAVDELRERILLFGGYDGRGWLNDLNQLNPQTLEWTPVRQRGLIPSGRSCPAAATHEQGLFLFGGYNGVERLSDIFRFDLNTEVWTVITTHSGPRRGAPQPGQFCCWAPPSPFLAAAAAAAAAAADNNEEQAAAAAGAPAAAGAQPLQQRRSNNSSSSGDWCYCSSSGDWCYCSSSSNSSSRGINSSMSSSKCCCFSRNGTGPAARYFHTVCVKNGKMFVFGGYSGQERLNDFHELDLETYEWRCIDGRRLAPSGRSSMVGAIYGNRFLVFGGYDGQSVLNDFYSFQLDPLAAPPSTFVAELLSLRSPLPFSDAAFLVEGKLVHSSRALLACRSDHFRALFFGGLKEANDTASTPITIEGIRHEVFVAMLEYLHTDVLPRGLQWGVLVELLIAAERVCVDRLKFICITRLKDTFTPHSAVGVLAAAEKLNILPLKELALDFLSLHKREVRDNPDILRPLSKDLLLQLLGRRVV